MERRTSTGDGSFTRRRSKQRARVNEQAIRSGRGAMLRLFFSDFHLHSVIFGSIMWYKGGMTRMAYKHNEFLEKLKDGIQVEGFTIKDPLIIDPVQLTNIEYKDNQLLLTLHQPVNQTWIDLLSSGGYTSVLGYGPDKFEFRGNQAKINVRLSDATNIATDIIKDFKEWIQKANSKYPDVVITRLKKEKALKEDHKRQEEEKISLVNKINEDLKKLI
jgi:hypothetical protein